MVRNYISKEQNDVSQIFKTLIKAHIEYCTKAWILEGNIEMGHATKSDKNNKKNKKN